MSGQPRHDGGNKRTTQLNSESPLELPEDLRTGDGLPRLVVLNDGGLLVDLLREVLLGELLLHASGLDRLYTQRSDMFSAQVYERGKVKTDLSDGRRDLRRRCNLVFAVELGYPLVVSACRFSTNTTCVNSLQRSP